MTVFALLGTVVVAAIQLVFLHSLYDTREYTCLLLHAWLKESLRRYSGLEQPAKLS